MRVRRAEKTLLAVSHRFSSSLCPVTVTGHLGILRAGERPQPGFRKLIYTWIPCSPSVRSRLPMPVPRGSAVAWEKLIREDSSDRSGGRSEFAEMEALACNLPTELDGNNGNNGSIPTSVNRSNVQTLSLCGSVLTGLLSRLCVHKFTPRK